MELRQKYIEEKRYDVEDEFLDALQEFELPVSLKIARFIEQNNIKVKTNNLVSHVLGGLIIYAGKPVTFAVEIVKVDSEFMKFTDISRISMDEYLDLRNLNLYIKSNERTKNKSTKSDSEQCLQC
tara:strand:+ start:87 stop:461 length:375 start_codon:yes stop_codon:yes gene_type:complete